jgi:hypothetical protein
VYLLLVVAATRGSAATYFVATDGRAAGDGSAARPWPSVADVLSRVGGGHTTVVKAGLYPGPFQIHNYPAPPGGPPTLIQSEEKWKAVVNGGEQEAINVVDCPGLILDGFEVVGARADGISMNTDQGTVRNCWVHTNGAMGISSHSDKYVTLEANLIEFNGCNIQYHHGVYADGEGLTVRRSIVRHNAGYGLHLYPSLKASVVSGNLVIGHAHQAGMIIACPEGGGGNRIVHNTVAGGPTCIEIWRGDGEQVMNNILIATGEALSLSHDTRKVIADYNLCQPDLAHQGPHSLAADPLFVNPGKGVFWLRQGSPALGKGAPEYAPATDFWGRPLRPGPAPDLGAFAFVLSLATEQADAGWQGYPYGFAAKGEMELRDPWAPPKGSH